MNKKLVVILLAPLLLTVSGCDKVKSLFGAKPQITFVAAGEAEVGVALAEAVAANGQSNHEAAAKQRMEIRGRLYGTANEG